jgi:hypothetical protein
MDEKHDAVRKFLREWKASGQAKNLHWGKGHYRFGQQGFLRAAALALGIRESEVPARMDAFTAEVGGLVKDTGGTELVPRGRTPVVRDWHVPVDVIDAAPGGDGDS